MSNYYFQKSVLVTGSGGLLATHLTEALVAAGARVRVVGRRPRPAQFPEDVEYQPADLLRCESRRAAMRGIEMVFHLAAVGWGFHENLSRQAEVLTGNILLNTLVLDAARRAGAVRYMYVSSAAVYPESLEELDESAALDSPPHGSEFGLGWAKRIGEIQAQTYHKNYSLRVAIVRPSNPYGPWDDFDPTRSHVIPALIHRAVAREAPIVVWGSGRALRSYIYARDVARAMLVALERCADSDPINVASPEIVSVADLVRLVIELCGYPDAAVVFDARRPEGRLRKAPCVQRAASRLGLTGCTPLREGLTRTIEWYRAGCAGA